MWLLIAFIAVPLIEIGLFIQVGGAIGLWPTLLIVLLTAIIGTYLVRAQGRQALAQLQASFSNLRDPSEPLAHGAMILFAGALLLTPGFFTDAVGLALLLPPVRDFVFRQLRQKMRDRVHFATHRQTGPQTVDGTYEPVQDPTPEAEDLTGENRPPRSGPSGWTRP